MLSTKSKTVLRKNKKESVYGRVKSGNGKIFIYLFIEDFGSA